MINRFLFLARLFKPIAQDVALYWSQTLTKGFLTIFQSNQKRVIIPRLPGAYYYHCVIIPNPFILGFAYVLIVHTVSMLDAELINLILLHVSHDTNDVLKFLYPIAEYTNESFLFLIVHDDVYVCVCGHVCCFFF